MDALRSDILTPLRLAQMEAGSARRERLQPDDSQARSALVPPSRIKVTGTGRGVDSLKSPPKPVNLDLSWVEQLQRESQQRFDRFMAQRPGLGISSEFNPNFQLGIKAYQSALSRPA